MLLVLNTTTQSCLTLTCVVLLGNVHQIPSKLVSQNTQVPKLLTCLLACLCIKFRLFHNEKKSGTENIHSSSVSPTGELARRGCRTSLAKPPLTRVSRAELDRSSRGSPHARQVRPPQPHSLRRPHRPPTLIRPPTTFGARAASSSGNYLVS